MDFRYEEFSFELMDFYNSRVIIDNGVKKHYPPYEITGIMMHDGRIFCVNEMASHDTLFLAVVNDFYPEIKKELLKSDYFLRAFKQYQRGRRPIVVLDKTKIFRDYKVIYMSKAFGIEKYTDITEKQVEKFNWLYDIGYYDFIDFHNIARYF